MAKVLTFPTTTSTNPQPPAAPAAIVHKAAAQRADGVARLLRRIEGLDAEQMQVVEIIIAAILRGDRRAA